MTATFILLFYMTTYSATSGMTLMSAEFSSKDKCEAAGREAEKKFGGVYSRPYWFCAPK